MRAIRGATEACYCLPRTGDCAALQAEPWLLDHAPEPPFTAWISQEATAFSTELLDLRCYLATRRQIGPRPRDSDKALRIWSRSSCGAVPLTAESGVTSRDDGLGSFGELQLGEDIRHVVSHGLCRQEHLLPDLRIR
jgi:hypothetical protein